LWSGNHSFSGESFLKVNIPASEKYYLESIENGVVESMYSYVLTLEKVVSYSSAMTLTSKYYKIAADQG
jgi:hypothetical protein